MPKEIRSEPLASGPAWPPLASFLWSVLFPEETPIYVPASLGGGTLPTPGPAAWCSIGQIPPLCVSVLWWWGQASTGLHLCIMPTWPPRHCGFPRPAATNHHKLRCLKQQQLPHYEIYSITDENQGVGRGAPGSSGWERLWAFLPASHCCQQPLGLQSSSLLPSSHCLPDFVSLPLLYLVSLTDPAHCL